jgi:SHS family sialic acid transporter-like MFS transporter
MSNQISADPLLVRPTAKITAFGKWMALTAALLGWMFDGLEMGLFPLVAKPALEELLENPGTAVLNQWLGIITALFLVGAATGGVLFGWLGDRIGRVRAMMLSVLVYALVSGLCGFATSAWQIGILRFVASLGMGGEWSLGVALINEIWPDRSRAFLAGLIGAAANVGYMLIAIAGIGLSSFVGETRTFMTEIGLPEGWVSQLLSHQGWRFLMMLGALPALLTFLIRLYVPESARWEEERDRGATSHWANRDLFGVLIGSVAACGIVGLWAIEMNLLLRIVGSLVLFAITFTGFIWPVMQFLHRSDHADVPEYHRAGPTLRRMVLGACLSGVALLGTWGSVQQAPTWSAQLNENTPEVSRHHHPREYTQAFTALGAVVGTIIAAYMGSLLGRRVAYFLLCLASLGISQWFYRSYEQFEPSFFGMAFAVGAITASFYGWLPLYLPEIFRTTVRATGQGFGFNFGRVLAAIGVLQLGTLTKWVGSLPQACAVLTWVYVIGMILIWFVPETKGQPLPE